ncbi:MAG TPA: hypothetical protein GX704_04860 [Clostridiales bacterium]|jgi:hypothetical protein|nr:hypothetical protein [Clostridiales bacterium]
MIKGEFRKHLTLFSVIFVAVLLVFDIGLPAWQYRGYFTDEYCEYKDSLKMLLRLYEEDRPSFDEIYGEYKEKKAAYDAEYTAAMMSENFRMPVFQNSLIDNGVYDDIKLMTAVEKVLNSDEKYQSDIAYMLHDAASRLSDDDLGSYLVNYYGSLISEYDKFYQKSVGTHAVFGWNEYFSLKTPTVLIIIALSGVLCTLFTVEDRTGMTPILLICRRGNKSLSQAKLIYAAILSAAVSVVFTLAPLAVFAFSCGLSDISVPLQALDGFAFCRFDLSIGSYLLIFILVRTLTITVVSVILAAINRLFMSEAAVLAAGSLFLASGLLLSRRIDNFRLLSLTGTADVNMLFDRFNGIRIFDFCIDHLVILLTVIALLAALAAAVLVYIGIKQKKATVSKERSSGSGKTLSLGTHELYKQLVANGGIYIIMAFIVIRVVWAGYYFRPTALYHELAFADYMLRLEGEVTEEKLSWIDEEYAYIEKSLAEYPEIQSAYREGKVSPEEYTRVSGRYSYAKHYKEAAEQLIIRADYLTEKAKTHENIMFVEDRGYRRLVFAPPDMITAAAAIILFSRLFSCEYGCGIACVIRLAKKGRNKTYAVKLLQGILTAILLKGSAFAADIFFLKRNFSMNCSAANINSLPSLAGAPDMGIAGYIAAYELISAAGFILLSVFASSFSLILENGVKALTTVAAVVVLPVLIGYAGADLLKSFSFAEVLAPSMISGSIPAYIICAAAASLMVTAGYFKWNGQREGKLKRN